MWLINKLLDKKKQDNRGYSLPQESYPCNPYGCECHEHGEWEAGHCEEADCECDDDYYGMG